MTTNIERAADVIDRWTKAGGELNSHVGSPNSIAQALADAGLLAPDDPFRAARGTLTEWWLNLDQSGDSRASTVRAVIDMMDDQMKATNHAEQEEGNDGEKKYTVRYYNPIMGVYETHWDTQEEAEKEAAYDHGMNGAPTRVLDPDGNKIATFEEGQRHA